MTSAYSKILCPIDGSEVSRHCAAEAVRLAHDQHAKLCFLYVANDCAAMTHLSASDTLLQFGREHGREILARATAEASTMAVAAQSELADVADGRSVAGPILEKAREWDADLIVMGARGHCAESASTLGGDATEVLRHAAMPVLLVK